MRDVKALEQVFAILTAELRGRPHHRGPGCRDHRRAGAAKPPRRSTAETVMMIAAAFLLSLSVGIATRCSQPVVAGRGGAAAGAGNARGDTG